MTECGIVLPVRAIRELLTWRTYYAVTTLLQTDSTIACESGWLNDAEAEADKVSFSIKQR